MNITYAVPRKKYNRIVYRIGGIIFFVIAAFQFSTIIMRANPKPMLTIVLAVPLGFYGLYLIWISIKKQAFNIAYTFTDEGIDIKHHYGNTHYSFDDIEFVTMVIADAALTYYILNVKTKKDKFIIPFPYKGELCEKIYNHIDSHIKHDEDDDN